MYLRLNVVANASEQTITRMLRTLCQPRYLETYNCNYIKGRIYFYETKFYVMLNFTCGNRKYWNYLTDSIFIRSIKVVLKYTFRTLNKKLTLQTVELVMQPTVLIIASF